MEDPSYEFVNMKDEYDIGQILKHGFFQSLKYNSFMNVITSENYQVMTLDKKEVPIIEKALKLSSNRVTI